MDSNDHSEQQTTTGLVAQRGQLSVHSQMRQEAMRQASPDDFQRELTACLALCAASGMNDHDRREWLITARATLTGIPSDLLARGCRVARTYCDHPSKIVPTIMREVEVPWETRKRAWAEQVKATPAPAASTPQIEVVTPDQIAAIKAEIGLTTNPYPDQPKPTGATPRIPTRADYIAMGVDPAVLDAPKERVA